MNIERFIANRISGSGENKSNISKPIVKIGIIGISLGISVMLLTVSVVLGFKKEIIAKITGLTSEIVINSINLNSSNEPEPILLSSSELTALKSLTFVNQIQRTAFKNGILKTKTDNEGLLLKGVEADFDFNYLEKKLVSGKLIDLKEAEISNEIMISESLATKMNLNLGAKMLVYFIAQHTVYDSVINKELIVSEKRSRNFKICGIFKTDFSDFDDQLSIIDLRQIQRLNYWKNNECGAYELKTKSLNGLEFEVEKIRELLGYDYSVNSVRDLYTNIFIWLDKLDINGIIIIILMVLVATVNMVTALLILILERTNMIGLLKTLGMPNTKVRNVFLWLSLRLIGKGMFYGNVIGIGLCLLQYHFKIAELDPQIYYIEHVAIELNWWYFLILNAGTFLICLLMLILPTLILSKLTPMKTIKYD